MTITYDIARHILSRDDHGCLDPQFLAHLRGIVCDEAEANFANGVNHERAMKRLVEDIERKGERHAICDM